MRIDRNNSYELEKAIQLSAADHKQFRHQDLRCKSIPAHDYGTNRASTGHHTHTHTHTHHAHHAHARNQTHTRETLTRPTPLVYHAAHPPITTHPVARTGNRLGHRLGPRRGTHLAPPVQAVAKP
eukprot:531795-Prorocentrum_minimum.AAC.1